MPRDTRDLGLPAVTYIRAKQGNRLCLLAAWQQFARAADLAGRHLSGVVLLVAAGILCAPQVLRAQFFQVFWYTGSALQVSNPQYCQESIGGVTGTMIISSSGPGGITLNGGGLLVQATGTYAISIQNGQVIVIDTSGYTGPNNSESVDEYFQLNPLAGRDQVNVLNQDNILCSYNTFEPGFWTSVALFQAGVPKMLGGIVAPPNAGPGSSSAGGGTDPALNVSSASASVCAAHALDPVPNTECGDPFDAATGNAFQAETDFVGGPSTNISFARYYNSQDGTTGGFGTGWHSTYHRGLAYAGSAVVVTRADGREDFFTNTAPGVWTADPDVTSVLNQVPPTGAQTGWTLTLADDSVETYTLTGQLTSITTRAGLTTTLSYNASEQLATVIGPFGHTLSFGYDGSNRVNTMTVPGGGLFTYGYGSNGALASVTYPDQTSRQYLYENTTFPSALTGIIDEDGNRYATWAYDTQYRAVSSQHAGGADLTTVTYNADGSSTVTDANGNAYTVALTTQFNVVKPSAVTGVPTQNVGGQSFTWDPNGFVQSVTDFDNNLTTYTHDTRGDQTQRVEASGTSLARTISTQWLPNFHLPSQITEPNRVTNFDYDANGNMLSETVTAVTGVKIWQWTYNAQGQVLTATDPDNNVTTYAYDEQGDLSTVIDALQHTTSFTKYDPTGRPLSITDPNGVVTTLAYDLRERLLTSTLQTSAGNLVTSYGYDPDGDLTKVTLPDGSYIAFTYDPARRLTKIADALGNSIVYTLDAVSNIKQVRVFDPSSTLRRTRSYVYDSVNRLHQEIGAYNETTTYAYDPQSNLTGVTDPLNHVTTYGYDQLNRLISALDPNKGLTSYAYNANDYLTGVTDPNTNTTTYTRDGFGQVTQTASPDTGNTFYYYDAAGNLTQRVDATNATTNYTYDALNRVQTTQYPSDPAENVAYTYDEAGHGFGIGRLTSLTDESGSLSRNYDERGNILSETRVTPAGTLATSYGYDPASRVLSIAYPSGTQVTYTRNTMGLITAVKAEVSGAAKAAPVTSAVTYEPFGPMKSLNYGNAVAEKWAFDLDYRPTSLTDTGISVVQKLTYHYDAADNVKAITDGVTAGNSQSFVYDVLNRLKSATGGYGTFGYTYDPVSNILTQTQNGTRTAYSYKPGTNRLARITVGGAAQTVATTAAGEISGFSPALNNVAKMTYNQAARLATASSTTGQLAQYTYDAFGHRAAKTGSLTGTTLYQYDFSGHLLEETAGPGSAKVDYVYLDDRPVGTVQPSNKKTYFLHADRLGTPQLATDSSQTVQWSAAYQPYGYTSTGASGIVQNLRLPGQEWDAETGLYHNGFRDYAPSVTRYIQSDPIGLAGGINTYQYAMGNPLSRTDPQGEFWPEVIGIPLVLMGFYEYTVRMYSDVATLPPVQPSHFQPYLFAPNTCTSANPKGVPQLLTGQAVSSYTPVPKTVEPPEGEVPDWPDEPKIPRWTGTAPSYIFPGWTGTQPIP